MAALLVVLSFASPVRAAGPLVVDLADVLSEPQESALASAASELGSLYQQDIVIVTASDTGGKSARDYADDFFDDNGYGVGAERNGILLLIDLDNRDIYISTSGSGIQYLTDQRIESVLEAVFAQDLGGGDFYGAAQAFLAKTGEYLAAGIPSDQYSVDEKEAKRLTWWDSLIGLVAAGGSGLGFMGSVRQRYKTKYRRQDFDFRSNSLVHYAVQNNQLLNTRVTHRLRPVQDTSRASGSGGRSTTHTSGSGRTHGGGGRGF
jgi:uncharacterized protein